LLIIAILTNQISARRKLATKSESEALKDEVCELVSDNGEVVDDSKVESWNEKMKSGGDDLNLMEESMKSDGDAGQAGMDIAMSLIVYGVFAVLSFLGFFVYLYFAYCCCARCC